MIVPKTLLGSDVLKVFYLTFFLSDVKDIAPG